MTLIIFLSIGARLNFYNSSTAFFSTQIRWNANSRTTNILDGSSETPKRCRDALKCFGYLSKQVSSRFINLVQPCPFHNSVKHVRIRVFEVPMQLANFTDLVSKVGVALCLS